VQAEVQTAKARMREEAENAEPIADVDDDEAVLFREDSSIVARQRSASGHEGTAMNEHQHGCTIARRMTGPDVQMETILALLDIIGSHHHIEARWILRGNRSGREGVANTGPSRRR
jgi:hypothetical protein